jgi:hypothetical protein
MGFSTLRERVREFLAREDMQKLKDIRDAAVHCESLAPESAHTEPKTPHTLSE